MGFQCHTFANTITKSTYINKVDAEAKARKVRKATKKKTPKSDSQYEMIKRAYD